MGCHPYCIVPPDRSPSPGLEGLDGAPVRALVVDPVAVWYTELEATPEPSVPALRIHDAVIRAAAGRGGSGPLPVRFGGWLASRQTLERRIRERSDAYRGALERLGDAREYGLRILDPEEWTGEETPGGPPGSGTEYMKRLARRQADRRRRADRAEDVLGALREAVGDTAVDERIERPSASPALLSVAHLVRPADADAYRDRVRRFRSEHPGLSAVPTGPWAPYSFAP